MSSATFDPNKIRVEDLFRAKEERRQRLAKLPFEEKIKIVEKLQRGVSAAMKNEKLIFNSFLSACPDFAGEVIAEWDVVENWYSKRGLEPPPHPFDKRPDVIALTASGKRIGIELKSWVNREQITAARKFEKRQDTIEKAVGRPPNHTENIGYVRFYQKEMRFNPRDAAEFRAQFFRWIDEVDCSWTSERAFERSSKNFGEFSGFPLLEEYLNKIEIKPRTVSRHNQHWIRSASRAYNYSPNTMLETLKRALLAHRSDPRYKELKTQVELDEVYLLVHYDFKAFAYNTPFDAPNFGFKEAAQFAAEVLNGDGGCFDRIFLFHFLSGEEEAYQIAPNLKAAGQS